MSNDSIFLKEVKAGIGGHNPYIETPFSSWDRKVGTIQKKKIYLVGAPTKTGKTTWVDFFFVINTFLRREELARRGIKVHIKYHSYEIDLVEKLANYTAFFLYRDYRIRASLDFIMGLKEQKPEGEMLRKIIDIENKYLIPMFGKYDQYGQRIEEGMIDFIEYKENPTGIYKKWLAYAKQNGEFITKKYGANDEKEKLVGYKPHDPGLFTIGIFDHVGLIPLERGYNKKKNLDTFSQYLVRLRNLCKFTFVPISQFNRSIGKTDRLKFSGEILQPDLGDFKDTGNLAEDANQIVALFSPSNYPHLEGHLGYDLNKLQTWYRSVHVLANRSGAAPVNYGMFMDVIAKRFTKLPKPDGSDMNRAYEIARNIMEHNVL